MVKLKEGPLHIIIRTAAEYMATGGFKRPYLKELGEAENEETAEETVAVEKKEVSPVVVE